jgi:3-hydroxybutyryl-CoA dehydrogenase
MHNIQKVGVVGLGQMGRGIAQVAIQHGFSVVAYDAIEPALEKSNLFISEQLKKGVEKQKWTQAQADSSLSLLKTTSKLSDLAAVDIVIEAAVENKHLKFEIFKKLDEVIQSKAILASNTSSISITEIAAQTKRPELVVGMHFMNPVPVMKLVEGIKGLLTSEETFQRVEAMAVALGKTWVKAQDYPGFAVNRILMPMINEAFYALYEGVASAKDIDQAMKLGTNQPMGPFELADFIGLDTCLSIMNVLFEGLGDTKYRACPLLKNYVASGQLGRKTKQGVYQY